MSGDDQNTSSVPDAGCARDTIEILVQAFTDLTSGTGCGLHGQPAGVRGRVRLVGMDQPQQPSCPARHEAGLGHESGPCGRSIMEYMLVMQWVDVNDEVLAAVWSANDERRLKLFNEFEKVGWDVPT